MRVDLVGVRSRSKKCDQSGLALHIGPIYPIASSRAKANAFPLEPIPTLLGVQEVVGARQGLHVVFTQPLTLKNPGFSSQQQDTLEPGPTENTSLFFCNARLL